MHAFINRVVTALGSALRHDSLDTFFLYEEDSVLLAEAPIFLPERTTLVKHLLVIVT